MSTRNRHLDRIAHYLEASRSAGTERQYQGRWKTFAAWCEAHGRAALPAEATTVMAFLVELADLGKSNSTIQGAAAAISTKHVDANLPSPIWNEPMRRLLAGMRRRQPTPRQSEPLTDELLVAVCAVCEETTDYGVRDRALLLVGWAAALRRNEISALSWDDVRHTDEGMLVRIGRSKTDQRGVGRWQSIPAASPFTRPYCAVAALERWGRLLEEPRGPLFRRIHRTAGILEHRLLGGGVNTVVQRRCEQAGMPTGYSAHSLRAGIATSLARAGYPIEVIAKLTRHRSRDVARMYIRVTSSQQSMVNHPLRKKGA